MKHRKLIGVVAAECNVRFQEELLRGIISQAFKSNCDVAVIAPFHNFYTMTEHKQAEKNIFQLIMSDRFDGFIFAPNTFFGDDIRRYIEDLLLRTGKPVLMTDSGGHRSFETAAIDDSDAFEEITDHLIDVHGCKKLYCLTGPKNLYISEERLKGFRNSLKKHSISCEKNWCIYGDFWHDAAINLARKIIAGILPKPDGIVCGNDVSASVLISELTASGIRVPEDIAVTGYDDTEQCTVCKPSLTSYQRPNFQLGAESFRRLYRIITGRICNKVPDESGGLRKRESCGCNICTAVSSEKRRKDSVNQRLMAHMLHSDMLFDITNVDNFDDFADRLDHYTYFIYKMKNLDLCLTRRFVESHTFSDAPPLTFSPGEQMKMVLRKSVIKRLPAPPDYFSCASLLPVFDEERSYPVAYYLSPLHYNGNFFGYTGISFGKEAMSFSSLFIQWVNYVNVALEQVRYKIMSRHEIYSVSHALAYDSVTGLLSRSGLEMEYSRRTAESTCPRNIECMVIHLSGISKLYYQSGEEKCRRMIAAFAKLLTDCLIHGELPSAWSPNSIGIISFIPDSAEGIYQELCRKLKESSRESEGCDFDFTLGVYQIDLSAGMSLSDCMHKAVVNRVYSYSNSEGSESPQFEKLCMLRSQIMKNPENAWNISDIAEKLFLSKSYLQKIYKSYFGKSIIEEMIEFRINKAKKLLSGTDTTITEISRMCGYSSYNYFVRQFKTYEGVSPSEYRKINA